MKKLFLLSILFVGLTLTSFAQSSAAFKYQAVARNAAQEVYTNQTLALRFSIILDAGSGSGDGTVVYSEAHPDTETSPLGVFALNIGQGEVLSGDWQDINWQDGYYFLKVDIDVDNGTDYDNVGKSPLLSVPFALHAATVTDKDDADADPSNELQNMTLNGTEISLSNGNTIDLASIIPPGGTDDQELTLNGNILQIEGGNSIDLAPLQDGVNDADADPSNELQNMTLNGTEISLSNGNTIDLASIIPPGGTDDQELTLNGNILQIEGGNSVDLAPLQDGVNDADADPNNEIQNLTLNGANLSIGGGNNVDLSNLSVESIWEENANNNAYRADGFVGIGTDEPENPLHIRDNSGAVALFIDGGITGSANTKMRVLDDNLNQSIIYQSASSLGDTATQYSIYHNKETANDYSQTQILNYRDNRLFPLHLGTEVSTGSTLDIRAYSFLGNTQYPKLQFTYAHNMPTSRRFIEQAVSTFGDNVSMNWTENSAEYGQLPLSSQAQLMSLTTNPLLGTELEIIGNIKGFNGRFTEAGGALLEDVLTVSANEAPFAIHADHAGTAPGTFVAGFHGSSQAGGLELSADSGTALKIESFGSGAAITVTGGNVGIGSTDPGALLTVGSNPSRFFLGPATTIGGSDAVGAALFVGNDDEAVVIERNVENMMSISSESAGAGTFTQEPLLLKTGNLHVGINDEPDNLFTMSIHQQAYGLSFHNNLTDAEWEIYHGGNLQFYYDGQYRGEISSADGVYTPSDRKFKDQIHDIGTVLPSLMQLKVNRYRYIHGNETNKQSLGLIAQEVQEIFPELVKKVEREGFDSNLTMNYSGFGVIAVKAIQEQQQIIDKQEERIEDLEARLLRLEELLKKF